MLTQIQNFLSQIPPLLLGFVVIVVFIVAYRIYEPPISVCDIQMQAVQQSLAQGFYQSLDGGKYSSVLLLERMQKGDSLRNSSLSKGIYKAFDECLLTNSKGGCLDIFRRFSFFEKQMRNIPTECGSHSATTPVRKASEKGFDLFMRIAWGEAPPKNKYTIVSWMDTYDLGIFCRMKYQYERLYGSERLKAFAWAKIAQLPGSSELPRKDQWERNLFNYPCKGLL
jgi:hypothetical protein